MMTVMFKSDFSSFYSARPGRPPKRSALVTPDTLEKLKKSRMENGDCYNPTRMMGKYDNTIFGVGVFLYTKWWGVRP